VQIEPSLRPQSPENGNISNMSRRLSAIPSGNRPNAEFGDQLLIRKSPLLAGLSWITEEKVFKRRTAWLGREDSNLRMVESKSTALPLGDAPTAETAERREPAANPLRPRRSIEGDRLFQPVDAEFDANPGHGFI
jgi:hypothetical protein